MSTSLIFLHSCQIRICGNVVADKGRFAMITRAHVLQVALAHLMEKIQQLFT